MAQTIVDQGSINRLRASVTVPSYPELNVISSYLGREGIRLALEGNATDILPTMTGTVTSPAPYQMATATVSIVKSTPLSGIYKTQFENDTLIGDITVIPDVTELPPYIIRNCALESVREMAFTGEEPVFVVTIRGYYQVNTGYFS